MKTSKEAKQADKKLAKMHDIRKQQMVYETKKEQDLAQWISYAKRKSKGLFTELARKQAVEIFELNYPIFKECPIEGSKLSSCPECGHINTKIKK